MTIIGFEKSTDGSRNLLVFDPMFHDAQAIISFTAKDPEKIRHRRPEELLKAYRRGARYLRRYNEFEILRFVFLPFLPSFHFTSFFSLLSFRSISESLLGIFEIQVTRTNQYTQVNTNQNSKP